MYFDESEFHPIWYRYKDKKTLVRVAKVPRFVTVFTPLKCAGCNGKPNEYVLVFFPETKVGLQVGCDVGIPVGCRLGWLVGCLLGWFVGCPVGIDDG